MFYFRVILMHYSVMTMHRVDGSLPILIYHESLDLSELVEKPNNDLYMRLCALAWFVSCLFRTYMYYMNVDIGCNTFIFDVFWEWLFVQGAAYIGPATSI